MGDDPRVHDNWGFQSVSSNKLDTESSLTFASESAEPKVFDTTYLYGIYNGLCLAFESGPLAPIE